MANNFRSVQIFRHNILPDTRLQLPSSKSESNRALIIEALSGYPDLVENLSSARDTQTMYRLLKSGEKVLDVIDAGTTMRFLTAYFAVSGMDIILTGTERMCERPIGILTEALKELGASITYLKNEGFPPIHIHGFHDKEISELNIRGDISSQFISALLMIAPGLKNGLTLKLTHKVGSRPYINMTLGIMKHFGVKSDFSGNTITIPPQSYQKRTYKVQPDWSGASYWYSFAALSDKAVIHLNDFKHDSFQGDRVISEIMDPLGVNSHFTSEGLILMKKKHEKSIRVDFTDCPDLAQTVAVVCAAKGIDAEFKGLESLKIKETDRIAALQNELLKFNSELSEKAPGIWKLTNDSKRSIPDQITFRTYEDHRMAMAFAPLATLTNIKIEDPDVVVKSYPSFWEDLKTAGFRLEYS